MPPSARRAFTLVELIVTLVVLAILAGIGLVTYSQVTAHAQVSATQTTLSTVGREAQALAAQRGDGQLAEDDFTAAAADLPAYTGGTGAAGGWAISTDLGGYVLKAGRLHVRVADDGKLAGVAAVAGSGDCVLAKVPVNGPVQSWSVGQVAANCSADIALARPVGSSVASLDPAQATPPAAPTGVTVAPAVAGFTVAWVANGEPNVVGYRLVVDGVQQPANTLGTSATVSAAPGAHTVAVVAVNSRGQLSPASATQTVTVPPATPASVTATLSGSDVTVAWTASAASTDYRVYRSVNGAAATLLKQVSAPTTTITDTAAPAGTTVTYSVAAANAGGESAATTAAASVTTLAGVPTGVTATADGATITVAWDAVPGASSYAVYRDGAATPTWVGSATSFADANLVAGSTHSYTVTAVDAAGEGAASTAVSGTVAPPAPSGVTAMAAGNTTTVAVTWAPALGATSYSVYRGGVLVGTTTGDATSFSDNPVKPGTWSYTVTASNGAGEGPAGAAASATVTDYATTVTATSGLVGYWRLGSAPGTTTLPDSAPGGQHPATMPASGVTLGQPSLISTSNNTSALFTPVSGIGGLATGTSASYNLSQLTVEAWVKTPSSGGVGWAPILAKDAAQTTTYNRDYNFYLGSDDGTRYSILHLWSTQFGATSTRITPMAPGSTHQVAVTVSATGLATYYVDGAPVGTMQGVAGTANRSYPVRIGGSAEGGGFVGGLDEVALYNRALSASEVLTHYQKG